MGRRARSLLAPLVLWVAMAGLDAAAQTSSAAIGCGMVHAVQSGDTCSGLANASGLSLAAFQAINTPALACGSLQLGQELCTAPCAKTYNVSAGESCWDIGNRFGVNITQHNPGLNCSAIEAGQTLCVGTCSRAVAVALGGYCWGIATDNGLALEDLQAINPGLNCSTLQPDQALCVAACNSSYTVAQGDSCWQIANNHSLTLDQLAALNPGLNCDAISPGQAICIGLAGRAPSPPPPAASPPPPGQQSPSGQQQSSPAAASPPANLRGCGVPYTIQNHDTCYSISLAQGRSNETTLLALNPGLDCLNLAPGTTICAAREARNCSGFYTVLSTDTCGGIAPMQQITIAQLLQANPEATCEDLQTGQVLCLPAPIPFSSPAPVQSPLPPPRLSPPGSCPRTYTVASGDTCYSISLANGASSATPLQQLNPALVCETMDVGQKLCLWSAPRCLSNRAVSSGDTCASVASAASLTLAQLQAINPQLDCANIQVGQVLCWNAAVSPTPESSGAGLGSPTSSVIGTGVGGTSPSQDSSSNSNAMAIGVGVGIGVGIPLIAAVALLALFALRRRRQPQSHPDKFSSGDGAGAADVLALQPETRAELTDVVVDLTGTSTAKKQIEPRDSAVSMQPRGPADLVGQALTQARKQQIVERLGALSYIEWDQITGVGGPGTAMEFMCQGGYGVIYKGKWQDEVVVVKQMEANGGDLKRVQEELAREAYIMHSCKHPNIAQIYGLSLEPSTGTPALVMRYCCKGSLRNVMDEVPELGLAKQLRMARDIAWGMQYLHARHHEMIVHGDLKTTNLLCDEALRVHISDFGLASMKTITRTLAPASAARTVVFSAPEILHNVGQVAGSRRSKEADVYAFGMILFELFTGVCPFSGANEGQIVGVVVNGLRPTIPLLDMGEAEVQQQTVSPFAGRRVPVPVAHLMERCWAQDPTFRPSFDQVVICLEAAAAALNMQLDDE